MAKCVAGMVIELDSYGAVLACHNAREHQASARLREHGALVDLMVIEGLEPTARQKPLV